MFKKFPDEIPEKNKKIVAVHEGQAYVTEYIQLNERVPEEELPDGILQAIRKTDKMWFADIPLTRQEFKDNLMNEKTVYFADFPEEEVEEPVSEERPST